MADAVDYLTKPVSAGRLALAPERVREKIAARTTLMTQEQPTAILNGLRNVADASSAYASRFLVKDGEKELLLPAEKIDWIEAAAYYSCLHANGHRYMLRETIADLSEKLDPRHFVRIHRSAVVNLGRIQEIYREGQAEGSVVLTSGEKLKMSKAGRQRLIELGKG